MTLFLLVVPGIYISLVHIYIIWRHRHNRKYSISEHAILDRASHSLYITSHLAIDVLIVIYSYRFFASENNLLVPHYLIAVFAVFDAAQALLPSKGKTEKLHFGTAYISWASYLLCGILALFMLPLSTVTIAVATAILVPILAMFFYMHINRSKLYPYQLLIVPLFVLYMSVLTLGVR